MSLRPRHLLAAGLLAAAAAGAGSAQTSHAVTAVGTLQRAVADDFTQGRATERFSLRTAGGSHRLAERQADQLVGQTVQVTGQATTSGLTGTASTTSTSGQTAMPAVTSGPRSVAVVMISFPDNRTQPFTEAQVRDRIFDNATDSLSAFYRQQTNGAITFTGIRNPAGDVFGPWASATPMSGCDIGLIDDAGRLYAQSQGVNLTAYDHVIYVTPRRTCAGGTPEGVAYMPGTSVWLNANIATWVTAHEVGHNLGSSHAGAVRCVDGSGLAVPVSATCTAGEYNDPLSVMGNSLTVRLTDAWHRHQNGELDPTQVRTATTPGDYPVLDANNFVATGSKLVLVPRPAAGGGVSGYFAVEARRPTTLYDTFAATSPVATGLTIRAVTAPESYANSYLVDTTPATASLTDAPLQPGQSLTDPASGVRLTNVSTSTDAPMLSVALPNGTDTTAPTVPAAQTFSVAGRTLSATWLASSDATGVHHYELERQGAGGVLSTTALTLTYAIPAGVGGAGYRIVAVDAAGNRSQGAWTYATPQADTTAPTVPGGPFATVSARTVSLSWTAATDDDRVDHYELARDGAVILTTTFLQATDTIPPNAPGATYRVAAVDPSGNRAWSTTAYAAASIPTATPANALAPPAAAPRTIGIQIPRIVAGRARLGVHGRLRVSAPGATRLTVSVGGRVIARRSGAVLDIRLPRAIARSRTTVVLTIRARADGSTLVRRIQVRNGVVTTTPS